MTDLEMIKKCAEKSGIDWRHDPFGHKTLMVPCAAYLRDTSDNKGPLKIYDPFHDDAQAMALVKKFKLSIDSLENEYMVTVGDSLGNFVKSDDLNRAIVECVAKLP